MKALLLESPKQFDTDRDRAAGRPRARARRWSASIGSGSAGPISAAISARCPSSATRGFRATSSGSRCWRSATGVANVKPGDRCSVEPYINDPDSYASRKGKPNCCEKLQVLGVHRDGGMRPSSSCRRESSTPRRSWLRPARPGGDARDRLPRGEPRRHPARRILPGHRRRADRAGHAGIRQADRREDDRPRHERAAPRLLQARRWACSIRSSSPRTWRRISAT